MDNNLEPLKNRVLVQVYSYFLAGITGVIGVFNWFAIRELQRLIVVFGGVTVWAWRAIDSFTFIGLGIVWLGLVYFSQHYYEKGFWEKRMIKRFLILNGIQAMLLAVAHFIAYLIRQKYGV